ncbi:MAG: 50S ribosomal protein L28 [Pseudomonadota bacterium]
MARTCMVTGKQGRSGNNRSHAENKTRRRFEPNLQVTSVYSEILKRMIRLRLTAAGLRTLDHNGGLDAFVMSKAPSKLSDELRAIRGHVQAAMAARQSAA